MKIIMCIDMATAMIHLQDKTPFNTFIYLWNDLDKTEITAGYNYKSESGLCCLC